MVDRLSATPLIAVDAVVVDTETTGLDPGKARIIQIGALPLKNGEPDEHRAFDVLVDPGEPIPEAVTRITGIADVTGAGPFADHAAPFFSATRDRVMIGHSIGFDLAVLKRECDLAGLDWVKPRTLDTRLLAHVAQPRLPDYSLDGLAAFLGISIDGRHTALGDARATAAVFRGLVPLLRERGIRTVAEAESACRKLAEVLENELKAGWIEPVRAGPAGEAALERIDAYPYRHRVAEVMSRPPLVIPPDLTLAAAMAHMADKRVSSVFVATDTAPRVADCGILTERDVLRAIVADGAAALDRPVRNYMHAPLIAVPAEAYLYRAIGRMDRLRVRHLGVEGEAGDLVGAISARDLLRLRASDAIRLGDEIDSADTVPALAAAFAKLPVVARGLLAEGISGLDAAGVVSRELAAMTRRAAVIAERRMDEAGHGRPPVAYAVMILGSGGRGESLLAPDQDNAIVYADGADETAVDAWFAEFATHVADILHEVGIPYCRGGVMAKNPDWRHSVSGWKSVIDSWIRRSRPQDLLNVDIFFDLRPVHGEAALAREIWRYAYDRGHEAVPFAKLMAEASGEFRPPLGFLGGFKLEDGRIDLKKGGLFPIVANARVLSIRHHVVERATRRRIEGLRALGIGADRDLSRLVDTHALLVDVVLRQQLIDIEQGVAPSNRVDPRRLSPPVAEDLKQALSSLSNLGATVRDLLFSS